MTTAAVLNRPKKVVYALRLLCLHLAAGLAVFAIELLHSIRENWSWPLGAYIGAYCFLGFFCLGFIFEIARGKNWARVTFTVLYCLAVILCIGITIWSPQYSPFRRFLFLLYTVLGLLACMQLVHPDAAAWFKEMALIRKKRLQRLKSIVKKPCSLKDIEAWESVPADEPLLIVKYDPVLYALSLIVNRLGILALFGTGVYLLGKLLGTDWWDGFGRMIWLVFIIFSVLMIDGVFQEIRLYKDRIVKVELFSQYLEIEFANASYDVLPLSRDRLVRVIGHEVNPWGESSTKITYKEDLMSSDNVRRMHRLLAALTGRKPEEFDEDSVNMKRLVKEEGEE